MNYYLTLNSEGKEELIASETKKPERKTIQVRGGKDLRYYPDLSYKDELKVWLSSSPRIPIKEEEREKFRKYAKFHHVKELHPNWSYSKFYDALKSGIEIPSELVKRVREYNKPTHPDMIECAYFITSKKEVEEDLWDKAWNDFESHYESNPMIYTSPNKLREYLKQHYTLKRK